MDGAHHGSRRKIGRQTAIDGGNIVQTMDADTTAKLNAIGDDLVISWKKEMEKLGLDGAAMVSDAKALVAKHSGD